MEKVFLNRTSRILAGHLWIFSNELATSPKGYEPGSLVEVYDKRGTFFGIGYINPHSLISIRLLTREREAIDGGFFRRRILDALNYREAFVSNRTSFRLIYSEGDLLPGLIVDKYADCLVAQFLTLGIERLRDTLLSLLEETLSPVSMVLRNDSRTRTLEGLPLEREVVKGTLDVLPLIEEAGVTFEVDPLRGQKTGFFLDQRENRIALSNYIGGGRGLDLFCYSGAWGLHLAKKGASVIGVDESEGALAQALRNARLNNLGGNCEFLREDVFSFLKREVPSGNLYDFIILDPPAFVKSGAKIKEGLKSYRQINSLAMMALRRGGVLATSSCSYHVDRSLFLETLRSAARDAGRSVRLLEYRSQGKDHPVLLSVPETEYLKCALLIL